MFALLFVFGKVPLTINRCSSCRYVVYMLSFCRLLFFTELYQECKHIMRLHQITDTKLSKPNFRSTLNLSIKSDGLYGWMTCVWLDDVCVGGLRVCGLVTCVWLDNATCFMLMRLIGQSWLTYRAVTVDLALLRSSTNDIFVGNQMTGNIISGPPLSMSYSWGYIVFFVLIR